MNPEDKKYVWWGLLGIGVAALFYFLSANKNAQTPQTNTINVPYLVPQSSTSASPTADTSLSNQPNIIGSSDNSQVPNFSNPYAVSANPTEVPGTWGFMPNLLVTSPSGIGGNVQTGSFASSNQFVPNAVSQVSSPIHV